MDNLENLTNLLSDFLTIYKFVNKKTVSDMLSAELNKAQLFEIYQLTDGNNSTRDIASKLNQKCTHVTIANIWKRWASKGIVVPAETKGRFKAAFSLEEYGITEVKGDE